jgi:hypothetical protein
MDLNDWNGFVRHPSEVVYLWDGLKLEAFERFKLILTVLLMQTERGATYVYEKAYGELLEMEQK